MKTINKPSIVISEYFRQNEKWIIWGGVVLFVYVVVRILLFGTGAHVYLMLSFLASLLFFSFINAIYGPLPSYESRFSTGSLGWLLYGRGFGPGLTSREKKLLFSLFIVMFLVADVPDVLYGILKLRSFRFEVTEDIFSVALLFLLLCGSVFRNNLKTLVQWLRTEIYWVRCIVTFFMFMILSVLLIIISQAERYSDKVPFLMLVFIVLYFLILLLYNLAVYRKKG